MEKLNSDYFNATALRREYLIGDAFLAKYTTISRDFIWQEQNERFKRLLARAWRMPFYRRLWAAHDVNPGDVRSLLDIEKLPVFDVVALTSAQENPTLFGDFTGQDSYEAGLAPPLVDRFFGPRGAEIRQLLLERARLLQSGRDGDYRHYSAESAGLIAVEGMDRDGLYLMEDAHYVELLSPLTQLAVIDGAQGELAELGELVVTSLYKDDVAPLIRFNTHDISAICAGESSLGLNLRRIESPSRRMS